MVAIQLAMWCLQRPSWFRGRDWVVQGSSNIEPVWIRIGNLETIGTLKLRIDASYSRKSLWLAVASLMALKWQATQLIHQNHKSRIQFIWHLDLHHLKIDKWLSSQMMANQWSLYPPFPRSIEASSSVPAAFGRWWLAGSLWTACPRRDNPWNAHHTSVVLDEVALDINWK